MAYNIDVNGDGFASPVDALIVINRLNAHGGSYVYNPLSPEAADDAAKGIWPDSNFDTYVSPLDALVVINYLNTNGWGPISPVQYVDPTLDIYQGYMPEADTVVAGSFDVPVASFDTYVNANEILTSFSFVATQGNIENGSWYRLWADTNYDGVVDFVLDETNPSGGSVTFSNLFDGGFPTWTNSWAHFEVWADIASNPLSNTLQVGFDPASPARAEEFYTGFPVSSENISLFAAPSTLLTIVDSGVVTAMPSDIPLRDSYVLGGTSETAFAVYLTTAEEPAEVTYIGMKINGDGQSVDRVNLYYDGNEAPFATATVGGAMNPEDTVGVSLFDYQLIIWEGLATGIHADAVVKTDQNGGMSGDVFSLELTSLGARGWTSSNSIPVAFDGVRPGPTETVVMSELKSVRNANPDADNTPVPTGISPVGQFTFTAASNSNTLNGVNQDVLEKLTFVIDTTNVALAPAGADSSPFRLYNKDNPDVYVEPRLVTQMSAGVYEVIFKGLATTPVNTAIGSGNSITLVLETNVVNPAVSAGRPSALQVHLDTGTLTRRDRDAATDTIFGEDLLEDVYSTLYRT